MSYLQLAALGKNHWWRYLSGILLIAFMWQVVGSLPLIGLVTMVLGDNDPATSFDPVTIRFEGVSPLVSYLAISFTFVGMLAGLYLTMRFLHQRAFPSLINTLGRMDWQRFLQGFAVYFGLLVTLTLVGALANPEEFHFSLELEKFLLFLPFALLLTPMQTCAEELLFRGYVMQSLGHLLKQPAVVAVISAIIFMLPHLMNPEARLDSILMPLNYFTLGLFLAIITLRDNALELAMGAHTANNLYAFTVVSYEGAVLESPAIFSEGTPDPLISLIAILLVSALFYWIVFHQLPPRRQATAITNPSA